MERLTKYGPYLSALIIVLIGLFSIWSFPDKSAYYHWADEGNYYQQAKIVSAEKLNGFEKIANNFISTPGLHDTPHPLRLGTILGAAVSIKIYDAFISLSFFSLINFLILLAGTYVFISKYWGRSIALFTLLLLAVSPIELAMARRALMDSVALTTVAFSFYAFVLMLDVKRNRNIVLFVVLYTLALLVKETALFILPFYTIVLWHLKSTKEITFDEFKIVLLLVLPVALVGGIDVLVYGMDKVVAIVNIILKEPSQYSAMWGQGPWYRYLLDYFVLSPTSFLLAAGFIGVLSISPTRNRRTLLMVGLVIYLLFIYSFMSKNIRYGLLLDIPLRLFAASMLLLIEQHCCKKRWVFGIGVLILLVLDLRQFNYFFITHHIYDPISYNLLAASQIVR